MSAAQNIRVSQIGQLDGRTLGITWTDGRQDKFDVVALRQACPCASCVDEWTHEQKLQKGDVLDTVRPLKVESVGQYALSIHFNDGHKTGIYTFSFLRKISGNDLH